MRTFIRTSLLGLLALPLAAQNSGISVGGGLILGFDSLKKATNKGLGFTANASYDTHVYTTDIPARIGLAYTLMPGASKNFALDTTEAADPRHYGQLMHARTSGNLKTSLSAVQLSADLLLDTGIKGLRGVLGLSVSQYSVKTSGHSIYSEVQDPDHADTWTVVRDANDEDTSAAFTDYADCHYPMSNVKGIKFGIRLGLEYSFTPSISGEAMIQQTELSGTDAADALVRKGALNPAWLQLGVKYHF